MYIAWCSCLVLVITTCVVGGDCACSCDDPGVVNAQVCGSIFSSFEKALINNESNLYKLRKLFYNSGADPPELVKITYYLQFTRNGSAVLTQDTITGDPSKCTCPEVDRKFLNTSKMATLRYGWSNVGVYTLIHPAILNQLQIQLPFMLMRLVTDRRPFLWNGYNYLPSTSIHLSIPVEDLLCLPDTNQLDGVIKTITSLVSYHHDWCEDACNIIFFLAVVLIGQ